MHAEGRCGVDHLWRQQDSEESLYPTAPEEKTKHENQIEPSAGDTAQGGWSIISIHGDYAPQRTGLDQAAADTPSPHDTVPRWSTVVKLSWIFLLSMLTQQSTVRKDERG